MFTKSTAAYLIGLKFKYIRDIDYRGHRNVTNEFCNVHKWVPTLPSHIPSLKSKRLFLNKISTRVIFISSFIIPRELTCQPFAPKNGCFSCRLEGRKEDAPSGLLRATGSAFIRTMGEGFWPGQRQGRDPSETFLFFFLKPIQMSYYGLRIFSELCLKLPNFLRNRKPWCFSDPACE